MDRNTFHCIDAHTCGNPVRVIKQGSPDLKGANMSEKRQHFLNADEVVLGAGSCNKKFGLTNYIRQKNITKFKSF